MSTQDTILLISGPPLVRHAPSELTSRRRGRRPAQARDRLARLVHAPRERARKRRDEVAEPGRQAIEERAGPAEVPHESDADSDEAHDAHGD